MKMRLLLSLLLTLVKIIAANASQKTKIEALRTVKNGEYLHPNTRFPIEFIGDWSSVLVTDSVDIMVDHDTIALDTTINEDNTNDKDYSNTTIHWSEGPLWDNQENCLYFSDPTQGIIFRLDNSQNGIENRLTEILKFLLRGPTAIVAEAVGSKPKEKNNRLLIWAIHAGGVNPSTVPDAAEPGSNGMTFDAEDPSIVYVCQHYRHSIAQFDLSQHDVGKPLNERNTPDYKILSNSNKENLPFNSPNDIITHKKDGSIWFTDPVYGLLQKDKFYDEWSSNGSYLEQGCKDRTGVKGVYRYNSNKTEVRLMTPFHRRPNGLAFYYGEDGDELWVADSTIGSPSWTSYKTPNSISSFKEESFLIADKVMTPATLGTILGRPSSSSSSSLLGDEGLSDGFKIDSKLGRLWTSIPNGFAVIDISSDVPKVICQILVGINTSNVYFGKDGEVWFTGLKGIWRVQQRM